MEGKPVHKTIDSLNNGLAVILDDFPLSWLKIPISQRDFKRHPDDNFPGAVDHLTPEEILLFCSTLEQLTDLKLEKKSLRLRLRVSEADEISKSFIHYDMTSIAGVLYLSDLPEGINPLDYGTHFYRHRVKGWRQLPADKADRGVGAFIINAQTKDLSAWEVINRVPFKKNRLVLYSGSLFHSPPLTFLTGNTGSQRITLDLFGELKTEDN